MTPAASRLLSRRTASLAGNACAGRFWRPSEAAHGILGMWVLLVLSQWQVCKSSLAQSCTEHLAAHDPKSETSGPLQSVTYLIMLTLDS